MYQNPPNFRNSQISQWNHCRDNCQAENTFITAPTHDKHDTSHQQIMWVKKLLSPEGNVWILADSKQLRSFLSSMLNNTIKRGCYAMAVPVPGCGEHALLGLFKVGAPTSPLPPPHTAWGVPWILCNTEDSEQTKSQFALCGGFSQYFLVCVLPYSWDPPVLVGSGLFGRAGRWIREGSWRAHCI